MDRYEDWVKRAGSSRSSSSEQSTEAREDAIRRRKEQEKRTLDEERAQQAMEATRQEQEWQRNALSRRPTEESVYYTRPSPTDARRRDDAEYRGQDIRDNIDRERQARIQREEDARRQADDEAVKRKISDRRQQEQAGILRRQQEAEAAARAARRDLSYGRDAPQSSSVVHADANIPVHAPQPSRPSSSQDVVFAPSSSYLEPGMPQAMPLESPNRLDYDSSTDAEGSEPIAPWQRGRLNGTSNNTPTRAKHGGWVIRSLLLFSANERFVFSLELCILRLLLQLLLRRLNWVRSSILV